MGSLGKAERCGCIHMFIIMQSNNGWAMKKCAALTQRDSDAVGRRIKRQANEEPSQLLSTMRNEEPEVWWSTGSGLKRELPWIVLGQFRHSTAWVKGPDRNSTAELC